MSDVAGTSKPPCPLPGVGFVARHMSPPAVPSRSPVSTRSWNSLVCCDLVNKCIKLDALSPLGLDNTELDCLLSHLLSRRVWTEEQAWGVEGQVHPGQDSQSCQRVAHSRREGPQASVWRYTNKNQMCDQCIGRWLNYQLVRLFMVSRIPRQWGQCCRFTQIPLCTVCLDL